MPSNKVWLELLLVYVTLTYLKRNFFFFFFNRHIKLQKNRVFLFKVLTASSKSQSSPCFSRQLPRQHSTTTRKTCSHWMFVVFTVLSISHFIFVELVVHFSQYEKLPNSIHTLQYINTLINEYILYVFVTILKLILIFTCTWFYSKLCMSAHFQFMSDVAQLCC